MNTLRQTLVKSYIASIALGVILAQGLLSLASIFLEPINRLTATASSRAFDSGIVSDPNMQLFDLPFSLMQLSRAVFLIGSSLGSGALAIQTHCRSIPHL
jgi:hypothetical protein